MWRTRVVFGMALAVAGSIALSSQSVDQERQKRFTELQMFAGRLTRAVLQGDVTDLANALSFEVILNLEDQRSTAAVREELQNKGEIYCRIFDTDCARRRSASAKFLSVRDILIKESRTLRTEIRFFRPIVEEDLDFAYITYTWGRAASEYGWAVGVMVEMERIGGVWKIRSLFPLTY